MTVGLISFTRALYAVSSAVAKLLIGSAPALSGNFQEANTNQHLLMRHHS